MKNIPITVKDKIAVNTGVVEYVCGNSDFVVDFTFDAEWDEFNTKTARFSYNGGQYQDVVFKGTQCPVPIISGARYIKVGVFAGDLHTTTPAYVNAKKSILCGSGVPDDPTPDVYAQIMSIIDVLAEAAAGCKTDADEAAASAASVEAAIKDFEQVAAGMDAAVGEAEQHAQVAQECAQAMAGTFDFTGYLRYQIVEAAPETFDEGVLYIVTTA